MTATEPTPPAPPERVALALVPAWQAAARVGDTVRALQKLPEVAEVLVVDDGSTDATAARALDAGAHCLQLSRNRGKGGALNAGLSALMVRVREGVSPRPAVLLLADADLGETAQRLGVLVDAVAAGTADVAIADVPPQEGAGGFGLAMGLARWGIRRLAGVDAAEPLSGQRALRWEVLERGQLGPFAPGFGVEVAMTVDALAAGLRVVELPVDLRHDATGRDLAGMRHRARQLRAIAREVGRRELARRRPAGRHDQDRHDQDRED
ncbi:MAG TPA: glycosyltransferase family 2 protein [Actinomycetes bacterium]|nr:glycosyltransferase family 2 protein [Actinomycetes bacterium]